MGVGEHLDALEEFHPDRMAGRILGMGDVLTLVEQAQQKLDQDEVAAAEARLRKGEFTLDDFRRMLAQARKLGPLGKIMGMIPGMGGLTKQLDEEGVDHEQDMKRIFGIIDSMTPVERRHPGRLIDQSRRRRIATGAGVEPHEVNELVKSFDAMAGVMKEMAGMGMRDRMRKMDELQQGGFLDPGARMNKAKIGTGKRLTTAEKAKLRKQREKDLRKRKRESGRGGPGTDAKPWG
jgi:signal recognition particle subunit SRP54